MTDAGSHHQHIRISNPYPAHLTQIIVPVPDLRCANVLIPMRGSSDMLKLLRTGTVFCLGTASLLGPVMSQELRCFVDEKVGTPEGTFRSHTSEDIKKFSYAVIIRDKGSTGSEIGRCSYSTGAKRVICNFYAVDHIERDRKVGHVKYYHFHGQFDVQVFSSMKFLENNGRGGLSSGTCEMVN